ncbi:MAG: SDR family NAD(P)-dependent oxidoreductase [Rhodocyclaceae bacterium]|jgi:2-hydroxycyclohexanecarboxyl-CoA dehydrogenase|nr:SDR family NAD(P)-dependent oxidoreductase [Rhodocyclaceae bacterium]
MKGLKNKLALVTGGAGGIGLAICRRLAAEGCTVGILDLSQENAHRACEAVAAEGGKAVPVIADISNYEALARAIGDFTASGKTIDILVNNAGWDKFGNFVKQPPELYRKVIEINLLGMMNVTHIVAPGMLAQGAGRIVNIASDAGRVGSAGESSYAAAKGGVIAFTKSMARELAGKGIAVNVVCPGPTETSMMAEVVSAAGSPDKLREALLRLIPMRRFGQPEDVAGVVAFYASDDVAYVTGQVVSVSGGMNMVG